MKLTPESVARFPRPGMAVPGKVAFAPDGKLLTFLSSERGDLALDLWEMDLATGARRVLFAGSSAGSYSREEALRRERERVRETGVTHYSWAADADVLLVPLRGDAYVDGEVAARRVVDPQLSRDGKLLAYVRDGELWAGERRLTHDAEPGVTNGLADYLAQEEMGRQTGFWISPDGRLIAFEQADVRHIPVYPIVHQGKPQVEIEEHRYPFAGAANPKVRLGVVPAAGGPVTWMDLGGAEYLARVAWTPDGRLLAQTLPRGQQRLELRAFDPATGAGRTLLVEESPTWINLHDDLKCLDDGTYVWASERMGLKQLYLCRGSELVRPLTKAAWPVDGVLRVTKTDVFFAGAGEDPVERHLWRVPLAGGEPVRLTDEPGWHDGIVARDGSCFVEIFQSRSRPPAITVRALDGRVLHTLHAAAEAVDLPAPEILKFKSRDGETLYGALYRPAKTPAPLVVSVYGGPHAQQVQDTWLQTVDLRAQYLAQRGFLVLKVDNRGSSRRGAAFEGAIARRLGDVEVRDQVDGVRHMQSMGLVDGGRVGINGWSYGGYMTLMCLCKAPEVFKAGVAGAPVTDWDGYDTCYTERYLGTPQGNPDGYRESSVMTHAHRLAGRLLIVHGMLDENVHFRHTARLLEALVRLGKPHELMILSDERHMPRGEEGRAAMEARVAEFFERSL